MKKLIAILMIVAMLASTFACAGQPAPAAEPAAEPAAPAAEPAAEPVAATDDEPVVLTFWRSTTSQYYIDENSETFQRLHETALKEANVDLQIEYFDWGDNYQQKLMMYCTDGSLPTGLWLFGGPTDSFYTELIDEMGQAGYLYDWTDYVMDTENYPNLSANTGMQFIDMCKTKANDRLYCVPSYLFFEYPHAAGGPSIRKDWMKELGMEYPTNEEELYKLIEAFSAKCVTPVSFCGFDNFNYWLNSWLGSSFWTKNADGEWDYGKYAKFDELDAALTFLNKCWNAGLMDKESFTQTGEQYLAKGANGDFGVTSYTYSYGSSINDALYEDAESDRYIVSIPTISCYEGTDVANVNSCEFVSSPVYRTVCVRNDETSDEYFAKIAKALDWIGSKDAGIMLLMGFEGSEWEYDANGKMIRTQQYIDNQAANTAWQYNSGLCFWSELNTNSEAGVALLNCINTRKSDLDSCANINGHQIGVTSALNIVPSGELETANWTLINDAWEQMVVAAISAASEDECHKVVEGWKTTLDNLGYQDIVAEKYEKCAEYGLEY